MINHVMYFGLKILLFHFKQLFFAPFVFLLQFTLIIILQQATHHSSPSPVFFLSFPPSPFTVTVQDRPSQLKSLFTVIPFISHYKQYWTFQTIFLRQAYLISYHSMHGYHNTLLGQKLLLVKKKISSRTTFLENQISLLTAI